MSEATLSLSLNELNAEIGWYLGFGRGTVYGETAWSVMQQNMIDSARKAGLNSFYTASAGQDDGTEGYRWSFLRPLTTLTLLQGEQRVSLPDDYHGLEGQISVASPAAVTTINRMVSVVGVGLIQEQVARNTTLTGWPQLVAVVPIKGTLQGSGQRFQFWVFPTADQVYSLTFTYYLNLDDLNTARPYPYGGAQHRETIIASCLAAAEQKQEDAAGVQTERFGALLKGSISVDRRNQPQVLGYCRDNSDLRHRPANRYQEVYDSTSVAFNGVVY